MEKIQKIDEFFDSEKIEELNELKKMFISKGIDYNEIGKNKLSIKVISNEAYSHDYWVEIKILGFKKHNIPTHQELG